MMDGQLNEIVAELNKVGLVAEISDSNIQIKAVIEEVPVELLCKLGEYFPYEFPTIYISPDSKKEIDTIPHINTDNSICVFDQGLSAPNFLAPVKMVCETVQKAIEVLGKGIRKENLRDFLDEFNAYWGTKSVIEANSFIFDCTNGKIIKFCFQEGKDAPLLISDSVEGLKQVYTSIHHKELCEGNIIDGILIPIDKDLDCSIPKTDIDIVKMIQMKSSYYNLYHKFIQSHLGKPVLLMFAQVTSTGIILSGWLHFVPELKDGFRPGHMNLQVAFSNNSKSGCAIFIEDCSQKRLFNRGGDGKDISWNKVAIIGCGSIGSMVAETLSFSGTSSFLLNDNQLLHYENIARHTCGYMYEGLFKTNAIEWILTKHNPNIQCYSYNKNAHAFLVDNAEEINDCDIVFVAVASFAVEYHICKLVNDGIITTPVVIIWVEPYALSGHAMLIKKRQDLFEELFDSQTHAFQYSIVENAVDLLKREAGCQSTYMPYSGFYLQMFISGIIEKIMIETIKKKGNHLLSWCGRLSEADSYGVKLTELAHDYSDFSIIERRID
ncbi:ThiF family adenylyltransferase [Blautia coccoides]|uniref:ThiF family adenylyltransferase n=1 Tax=Blautia producta TaxID=33035 RepID=UPI0028A57C2E|nr:ThiF family adenylyltransferase [Blautia coccoides]MDT4375385.1 ThiF family adenylyltransferase [Blautia coccoides]